MVLYEKSDFTGVEIRLLVVAEREADSQIRGIQGGTKGPVGYGQAFL